MKNPKAYKLAGELGKILEGKDIRDIGVALGIVLGQFVLLLDKTDEGIDEGIDSIATDAKDVAKKLRNMVQ